MCLPDSPPRDNSAEIARREEEAKQARIKEGVGNIDQAFAGFDEPFYQQYQDEYTGFYNPQLDDQYGDAVKSLTLKLAKTGNLTGSVGADQLGDLQEYYDQQKMALTGRALDATNQLRANIDTSKSDLYASNRAAADPGQATEAAMSAAQTLQPTGEYSPMANMFTDFFTNLGNQAVIRGSTSGGYGSSGSGGGVQTFGGSSSRSGGVYGDR